MTMEYKQFKGTLSGESRRGVRADKRRGFLTMEEVGDSRIKRTGSRRVIGRWRELKMER